MKLAVAVFAVLMLGACSRPDLSFGPGTFKNCDFDKFEYVQDNGWVYSTSETRVQAMDLVEQHCDKVGLYENYGDIQSLEAVGCHMPVASTSGEPGSTVILTGEPGQPMTCYLAVADKGYKQVPCSTK